MALAISTLYTGDLGDSGWPDTAILIRADGIAVNDGRPVIDSNFIYEVFYRDFAEAAEKYNVGFMVTETGGGGVLEFTEEQDFKCDELFLLALSERRIPWNYGALQNELFRMDTPGYGYAYLE